MGAFINAVTEVNSFINGIVWGWPMIILILGTGILITVRMRFMQVRKFGESLNSTIINTVKTIGKPQKKGKSSNGVSPFEAFSAAISGTVGTGNIIGVTSAILTGGPGAVVWMWVSAFFGMMTNYAENVLGLYYRKKDKDGNFRGGAFYYIYEGLHQKWLAYVAAIFCLTAAVGMSGVQTNKITGTLVSAFNISGIASKIIIGVVVALLAGAVIIGGIKRIGKISSMLVPFMSLSFITLSLIIIGMNFTAIPETFKLIFSSVFSTKSITGGIGGYAFSRIIQKGMARGVFSNEAGLGSSVIAHSASETREPVKQGMWGVFAVFLDTFVICTITALVILTTNINSGAFYTDAFGPSANDAAVALNAFSAQFGVVGTAIFSVILPLFAFTTILAWAYYGEKAIEFCFKWLSDKGQRIAVVAFKVAYICLIAVSALIESDLIWEIDDTFNGLMALPNLVALVILSGQVVRITKNYYDRHKRGLDVEPMLSAYPEQNAEFIRDIKEEQSN